MDFHLTQHDHLDTCISNILNAQETTKHSSE